MESLRPPWRDKKRSMRRSNSSGFFACFRPAVADRDDHPFRSRSNPLKDYIAFDDGKETYTLPEIASCPRGCKGKVDDRLPKDGARKRFAHATKAVLLKMSLVKEVQKKRKPKKIQEPNGDLFKKADRILMLMSHGSPAGKNDSCKDSVRGDYDVLISSHSSAPVTSISWTGLNPLLSPRVSSFNSLDAGAAKLLSRIISSEPKRIVQDGPALFPAWRFTSLAEALMSLILLTLAVLIFWGKAFAIVFTSTILVVAISIRTPRRGSEDEDEDEGEGEGEGEGEESIDSAEYKKRIIVEGLLQRQRPRAQLWLVPSS